MSDDKFDFTINFEDPNLKRIVEENLTESTKEKKAIDMVKAVEQQLDKFAISEEGLANANLLLGMMTKWYGENAKIIEDGGWLLVGEERSWQEKLEETIGKISVKIAEIHNKLDKNWEDFLRRPNYNALTTSVPYQGGRTRKRRRRRKRKTRKRKRKKSRKKRKKRRRRTRK
jgi:hypothetical protein